MADIPTGGTWTGSTFNNNTFNRAEFYNSRGEKTRTGAFPDGLKDTLDDTELNTEQAADYQKEMVRLMEEWLADDKTHFSFDDLVEEIDKRSQQHTGQKLHEDERRGLRNYYERELSRNGSRASDFKWDGLEFKRDLEDRVDGAVSSMGKRAESAVTSALKGAVDGRAFSGSMAKRFASAAAGELLEQAQDDRTTKPKKGGGFFDDKPPRWFKMGFMDKLFQVDYRKSYHDPMNMHEAMLRGTVGRLNDLKINLRNAAIHVMSGQVAIDRFNENKPLYAEMAGAGIAPTANQQGLLGGYSEYMPGMTDVLTAMLPMLADMNSNVYTGFKDLKKSMEAGNTSGLRFSGGSLSEYSRQLVESRNIIGNTSNFYRNMSAEQMSKLINDTADNLRGSGASGNRLGRDSAANLTARYITEETNARYKNLSVIAFNTGKTVEAIQEQTKEMRGKIRGIAALGGLTPEQQRSAEQLTNATADMPIVSDILAKMLGRGANNIMGGYADIDGTMRAWLSQTGLDRVFFQLAQSIASGTDYSNAENLNKALDLLKKGDPTAPGITMSAALAKDNPEIAALAQEINKAKNMSEFMAPPPDKGANNVKLTEMGWSEIYNRFNDMLNNGSWLDKLAQLGSIFTPIVGAIVGLGTGIVALTWKVSTLTMAVTRLNATIASKMNLAGGGDPLTSEGPGKGGKAPGGKPTMRQRLGGMARTGGKVALGGALLYGAYKLFGGGDDETPDDKDDDQGPTPPGTPPGMPPGFPPMPGMPGLGGLPGMPPGLPPMIPGFSPSGIPPMPGAPGAGTPPTPPVTPPTPPVTPSSFGGPVPLMVDPKVNLSAYEQHIQASAQRYNVDPALVRGIISQESNGKQNALSRAGAMGLMQLMPRTAAYLGVQNAWDPAQNIDGGTKYISQQLQKYGDLRKALAAYNWGPGSLNTAIAKYGDNWEQFAPRETKDYIQKIAGPKGYQPPMAVAKAEPFTMEEFMALRSKLTPGMTPAALNALVPNGYARLSETMRLIQSGKLPPFQAEIDKAKAATPSAGGMVGGAMAGAAQQVIPPSAVQPLSQEEFAKLKEKYPGGMSFSQISADYGPEYAARAAAFVRQKIGLDGAKANPATPAAGATPAVPGAVTPAVPGAPTPVVPGQTPPKPAEKKPAEKEEPSWWDFTDPNSATGMMGDFLAQAALWTGASWAAGKVYNGIGSLFGGGSVADDIRTAGGAGIDPTKPSTTVKPGAAPEVPKPNLAPEAVKPATPEAAKPRFSVSEAMKENIGKATPTNPTVGKAAGLVDDVAKAGAKIVAGEAAGAAAGNVAGKAAGSVVGAGVGRVAGMGAGRVAGGAIGGAVGSVVPVAGTIVGTAVGLIAGELISEGIGMAIDWFMSEDTPEVKAPATPAVTAPPMPPVSGMIPATPSASTAVAPTLAGQAATIAPTVGNLTAPAAPVGGGGIVSPIMAGSNAEQWKVLEERHTEHMGILREQLLELSRIRSASERNIARQSEGNGNSKDTYLGLLQPPTYDQGFNPPVKR